MRCYLWFGLMILTAGSVIADSPLPAPQLIPQVGEVTSAPYQPQALRQGGVVITLFPPDSPLLDQTTTLIEMYDEARSHRRIPMHTELPPIHDDDHHLDEDDGDGIIFLDD